MNRETILFILKENESLKLKVQRLEQSTERLQNRYYDAENELNAFRKKYDFLRDQFREIVRQCFPREFIEHKMRDYSEKEIYEFLVTKIRSLEDENFIELQERRKLEKSLKETLEELERWKNAGPMFQNNQTSGSEYGGNAEKTIGEGTAPLELPKEFEAEDNPLIGIVSLLDDKDWTFIKIIGEGETMFSNIATKSGLSNSNVKQELDNLVEKGIISFEKIEKGGRGRPSHHYFLTPMGIKIYEMKFNEVPTTTILEKMSTHGSPAHGGLMVEVGKFLEEIGCEVTYDGPETTFKLKDGREIIFDIKAYDPESKEMLFIETERAKCGEQHLQEKFDKCYQFTKLGLTKTIHIVAPDKQSLHQIQQQLFRWVRKNSTSLQMLQKNNIDKAVVIFKTATLEEFKNGKLQEFYYGLK